MNGQMSTAVTNVLVLKKNCKSQSRSESLRTCFWSTRQLPFAVGSGFHEVRYHGIPNRCERSLGNVNQCEDGDEKFDNVRLNDDQEDQQAVF